MPRRKQKPDAAERLFTAMGHPIRRAILAEFHANEAAAGKNVDAALSPNELAGLCAQVLGKPTGAVSQISYHVKILRDCDAIKLVRQEPRRGAVEHYYRRTDWMRLAYVPAMEAAKRAKEFG